MSIDSLSHHFADFISSCPYDVGEMYVRQGRFLEAARSFEKEIRIMRGDLGPNSTSHSVPLNVSDTQGVGAKNDSRGAQIEGDMRGDGGEGGPISPSLLNGTTPTPPSSLPSSNTTMPDSTSPPLERKVLTPKEKLKLIALHKRLGVIYAGQLSDVKAAAVHFESSLDLGGDMDRDMRMFFAKNAVFLSSPKGDRPVSELSSLEDTVEATSVPLEGGKVILSENSINDTSSANSSRSSSNVKDHSDSSSVQNRTGTAKLSPLLSPTTPLRGTERAGFRNRWVVRSDPVEEPAGEGEGLGGGQGTDRPVGGMKMGGMGGMRGNEGAGGGGGEGFSVGDEGDSRGKGGVEGESSFESQVRMNEEFEDDSGGAGGGSRTGQSSVLSSLSSSRRGR